MRFTQGIAQRFSSREEAARFLEDIGYKFERQQYFRGFTEGVDFYQGPQPKQRAGLHFSVAGRWCVYLYEKQRRGAPRKIRT